MTMHRIRITAATCLMVLAVGAMTASAQQQQQAPPPEQQKPRDPTAPTTTNPRRGENPAPPATLELRDELQRMDDGFYRRSRLRLFQNYTLPAGSEAREVISVLADVEINGTVRGDVAVTMGSATIGPTAVIEGDLVVVGGGATVAKGAQVGRDVIVIGGTLDAPTDFVARGEHVVIGTPIIGEWLRALTPWLTRGVLLGRLIVPDIGWVWAAVGLFFLFGLLFNHIFARQVGACADTLARRPMSAFFVGLLVILLAGPAIAVVSITVIGLPFAIAAMLAANIIGKLGVTRVIGRSILRESDSQNRGQAFRSYLIGSLVLILAFMTPIVGLMTWALIGVFGFGTAAMTFLASLRKERPVSPPIAPAAPSVGPVPPAPFPFATPEGASHSTSAVLMEDVPPASPLLATPVMPLQDASDVFRDEPPPIASAPRVEAPLPRVEPAAAPLDRTSLIRFPRASFLDRIVAFALDAILVAIVNGVLVAGYFTFGRGPDNSYLLMLFAYHVGFWAWKGTTLGGIICNLRMVRTTGEEPRFIDALVRALSAIFSVAALGIGVFWMINDAERQMWHDKFAGTVVVKLPRELVLA
jgi:uncharacterized RDD family membrane protein YckC